MKISERQAGDITILDVEGRVMFGDGEENFRDAVTRLIEAGRVKLVINMAGVPYIDSAGISQLVRAFVTAGNRGGRMKLLHLSRRVRELLSITRLLTVWEAFDSEEEAVGSFGERPKAS
jgi:anti-sigma B factor antagonist